MKKLTLSDLKRDAKGGRLRLEFVERYGKEIPEHLQGIREVIGANFVCIKLRNLDGKESELRIESAKLVEYDLWTLTIYSPALRSLTPEEQAVLDESKQFQAQYEKENLFGNLFWAIKKFFKQSACPWMDACDTVRGKHFLSWEGKVCDCAIRGEVALRYNVYMSME